MANQIFKDQTLLTIELETAYSDLASADSVKIYYVKPETSTKGSWLGTVDGTKIKYEVSADVLDEVGTWQLQAGIVVSGREALGTIVSFDVNESLK